MPRTRLLVMLIVSLALAGALASGCGGSSAPPTTTGGGTTGGTANVTEQNLAFGPSTLNVKVGDVVTFNNADSVPHHIVVGTKDLGDQPPGVSVTWTADKAGTIEMKCTIHPSMTGTIIVQ